MELFLRQSWQHGREVQRGVWCLLGQQCDGKQKLPLSFYNKKMWFLTTWQKPSIHENRDFFILGTLVHIDQRKITHLVPSTLFQQIQRLLRQEGIVNQATIHWKKNMKGSLFNPWILILILILNTNWFKRHWRPHKLFEHVELWLNPFGRKLLNKTLTLKLNKTQKK